MSRLDPEHYLAARRFIYDRGRDLERLLFQHEFESAPAWPVLEALAAYQNADGGYGRGLEPDSHAEASGALATSVALRVLADLSVPASHPQVAAAVSYLAATLDPATGTWRIVPPETEAAPHAPWWAQDGLAERFGDFKLNPRPDILAQLLRLGVTVNWLPGLVEDVIREAEERSAGGLEMHDLIACARLLEALAESSVEFEGLRAVVEPAAVAAVAGTTAGGYGIRALSLAPLPGSVLAEALGEAVADELAAAPASQAEDGAWWPAWTWGEATETEAWEASRTAWAGIITLDTLRSLAAAGRVERG